MIVDIDWLIGKYHFKGCNRIRINWLDINLNCNNNGVKC